MPKLLAIAFLSTSFSFAQNTAKSNEKESQTRIFSLAHEEALEKRLTAFIKTNFSGLKPEEMQQLANIIYFAYIYESLNNHMHNQAQEILFSAKTIQAALINGSDATTAKDFLMKKLQTIDAAIEYQQTHRKLLECAYEQIETLPKNNLLLKALEEFDQNVSTEVGIWATENKNSFNATLENCGKTFIETGAALTMIGNTYHGLLINKSPLPSIPENKCIGTITVASRNGAKVDQCCWKAIGTALQMTEAENQLHGLSIGIMGIYYKAVYTELVKQPVTYHTFMYNAQGLLPAEKRTTPLPQT